MEYYPAARILASDGTDVFFGDAFVASLAYRFPRVGNLSRDVESSLNVSEVWLAREREGEREGVWTCVRGLIRGLKCVMRRLPSFRRGGSALY